MASKLSAVLFVVFAASFMLASVVPFVAASSFFDRTYEGRGIGKAFSVVQTGDGGYAIAGAKEQTNMLYTTMWLIKTDSSGDMEWNQTYGHGRAHSVIQTSDGGYAMAGYKIEGFPTFCLVKTDEAGIIPEFPSWIILPLFITATLLIIICKQKLHKTANRQSY